MNLEMHLECECEDYGVDSLTASSNTACCQHTNILPESYQRTATHKKRNKNLKQIREKKIYIYIHVLFVCICPYILEFKDASKCSPFLT